MRKKQKLKTIKLILYGTPKGETQLKITTGNTNDMDVPLQTEV